MKVSVEVKLDDVQLLVACAWCISEAEMLSGPAITKETVQKQAAAIIKDYGTDFTSAWIHHSVSRRRAGDHEEIVGCALFKLLFGRKPPKKDVVKIQWEYPKNSVALSLAKEYMVARKLSDATKAARASEKKQAEHEQREATRQQNYEKSWSG